MADTNAAQSWRSWVLPPIGIFLASRLAVAGAVHITGFLIGAPTVREILLHWDADWYVRAAEGYDQRVPAGTGIRAQSDIAFFPALPLAIKFISLISGLSTTTSGFIAATILGGLAAVALWRLSELVADRDMANRTVALVFFFPGAVAFSTIYPEGLFILASSVCLWALIKEKWLIAGIFGALSSATRPNGVILIACCAWAAFFVILRRREWKALIAPALAPIGVIAFFVFLALHTGDDLAWFTVQSRGWGQQIDFGANAIRIVSNVARNPFQSLIQNAATGALILSIVGVWLLVKWRPSRAFPLFAIYSAGIIVPILLSQGFSLTMRSLMTAFPLLMAAAVQLKGIAFVVTLGFFASFLGLYTLMFGGSLLVVP